MQDPASRQPAKRTFRLASEEDHAVIADTLANDPALAAGRKVLNRIRREMATQPRQSARAQ